MKKSLIALAVLAASGASFAQSSVTISGTFDPAVANEKTTYGSGNSVTQTYVRSSNQATSNITFKGTEDLGGGLKASFLLENDFDPRFNANGNPFNGTNGLGGGQQFLGLAGSLGGLKVGAANTPTLIAQYMGNPFDTRTGGGFNVVNTAHVRNNNSVVYESPVFNGFNVMAGYAFQTKSDPNAAGTYNISTGAALNSAGTALINPLALNSKNVGAIIDLAAFYNNGPLSAGVSLYSVAATDASTAGAGATGATAAAVGKNRETNVYASYDLGMVKVMGGYYTEKTDDATGATPAIINSSAYNFGASVPLNANLFLMANYANKNDKTAANQDKKVSAVGVRYNLSKNTSVYARYVETITDNVTAATSVKKLQTTLFGMQTNF